MITVDIIRNAAGEVAGFSVRGHANAGVRGEDIVCAGVSALTQAAVMGLERHLGRRIQFSQTKECQLALELLEEPDSLTEAVLMSMLLGLKEISKGYPKNVRIVEHRR